MKGLFGFMAYFNPVININMDNNNQYSSAGKKNEQKSQINRLGGENFDYSEKYSALIFNGIEFHIAKEWIW